MGSAVKEAREALRDKRTLFLLIVMPMIFYPLMLMLFLLMLVLAGAGAHAPVHVRGAPPGSLSIHDAIVSLPASRLASRNCAAQGLCSVTLSR